MGKLTFEVHDGGIFVKESDVKTFDVEDEVMHTGNAIRKLAEYEDLEEQGKLLKLPCAVGDTVYCIRESWSGYVIDKKKFKVGMVDKFNKTVFLTQQEAEQALAEMEGKNGN